VSEIFGIPTQALFGQLLIGLINGSFYALLSLGLAVIFGLLNIINFTHGAQYMMGAFCAWFLLNKLGINYWWALFLTPIVVGATGVLIERLMLEAALSARSPLRPAPHVRARPDLSRACSATSSAPRGCRTRSRKRSRAAGISGSCSCRTIARG
jgi:hypothetical protein